MKITTVVAIAIICVTLVAIAFINAKYQRK